MGELVGVLLVIILIGAVVNKLVKAGQTVTGAVKGQGNRSKCAYCGKGLKSHPGKFGYAEYCSKCGRQQPWAEEKEAKENEPWEFKAPE